MDELIRVDEELDDPVFDASDGELGVTTVSVTHDQSEAMASSDRVAVLSAGRLEPAGDPRTLYRRPKTRFVSEFLGENDVFDADIVEGAWGRGPGGPPSCR